MNVTSQNEIEYIRSNTPPSHTPYILQNDNSNKYRVDKRIEKSVDFTNMIPFLRSNDDYKIKKD